MSDMKCPFCQQEMRRTNGTHNKVGVWQCQNSNDPDNVCIASGYLFNDDVLNYITRTRKALDVAVDAIDVISLKYHKDTPSIFLIKYAQNAKDQITALEQKDVK